MNIVLHARRIDLFVFAGYPETSDSYKLVLMLGDLVLRGIFIEVNQGKIESLLLEFKGLMDVN